MTRDRPAVTEDGTACLRRPDVQAIKSRDNMPELAYDVPCVRRAPAIGSIWRSRSTGEALAVTLGSTELLMGLRCMRSRGWPEGRGRAAKADDREGTDAWHSLRLRHRRRHRHAA